MVTWRRGTLLLVTWTFLAMLVAQVFLAGLGLFESVTYWPWHRIFGYDVIWPVAFVMLIAGLFSRLPGRTLILLLTAAGLTSLLPFLPSTASTSGFLAALHPVVAFVLFGVTVVLAVQIRRFVPPPWGRASHTPLPPSPKA